jgi:small subunit ribosomal protein S19
MSRSRKKGPFVDPKLVKKIQMQEDKGIREPIKTWRRACTVVPEFVGYTFMVHNGNKFLKVFVTEDMVGHKLGEFAPTRQFRGHSTPSAKAAADAAAAEAAGGGAGGTGNRAPAGPTGG